MPNAATTLEEFIGRIEAVLNAVFDITLDADDRRDLEETLKTHWIEAHRVDHEVIGLILVLHRILSLATPAVADLARMYAGTLIGERLRIAEMIEDSHIAQCVRRLI